ncbi:MAG TPA: DJ-1/PfpI family protein [Acidimicrobiales bacterium]|jgi:protease I|nr:DJ-1/PfpI family protein [Acidimicrobiales bacterium]
MSDYVALVTPGGHAPEYIRNDPDCRRIVEHFFGADKPIAQLCHASLVLSVSSTAS